jgi:hypothetical protein
MTEQELRDVTDAAPFGHSSMRGRRIPEEYVISANEEFVWRLNGRAVQMSGGFMEQKGHGPKSHSTLYIDGNNPNPNKPSVRKPSAQSLRGVDGSGYNIGIDYVVAGDKKVTPWYSGVVEHADLDGGYGYAVRIKTDYSYEYEGQRYPIYTQYSHLRDKPSVTKEQRVDPSTKIGTMGRTGTGGAIIYPEHVDFQSYIIVNGKKIQVSPNLMQDNLSSQAVRGRLRLPSNQNSSGNTQATGNDQPSNRTTATVPSSTEQPVLANSETNRGNTANLNNQQIDPQLKELYAQLYSLAVDASGGDNKKVIEYLRIYGENGTNAYAYNSPNTRNMTEENQQVAAAKAFEVPSVSSASYPTL